LLVLLAIVQLASDAIFSGAAAAHSLPAALPRAAGVAVYRQLNRLGPAPYVDDMLARAALDSNELERAEHYADLLPASPERSELFARIAQRRGDEAAAQLWYVRAGDVAAVDADVARIAVRDPRAAYRLQAQLNRRLQQGGTHPDGVAESYWQLGVLAARARLPHLALADYRSAMQLSPLSGKYLNAAGFQAYDLQVFEESSRDFNRAIEVDPASADAYAGAGLVALAQGDRAAALRYAAKSRALDPNSAPLQTLDAKL
jgi:hypothetical protein